MMIHSEPLFSIAFGNKKTGFQQKEFYNCKSSSQLLELNQFIVARKMTRFETLIVAKQTHGTDGLIIKTPDDVINYLPYQQEADFIITNLSCVGIAVATADCLPIILYDQSNHTIAVVHAGWQGTLNNIGPKAVNVMQKKFGCKPEYIKVFFGPCAQVGNYEVGPDFIQGLSDCTFKDQVIIKKNGSNYFNLPLYNQLLFEQAGIRREAFHLDYNVCTISDPSFCSHRRDGKNALRQMTIATLI
jgi:hypothetical protein